MLTTPPARRLPRGATRATATRAAAALALLALLLSASAMPAAAKELLQARLEAPISFASPPGQELEVAVLVTVPDGAEEHPVDGSPIWLRLFGPKGDVTEAPGKMGSGPGRYVMRIEVPPGGPRRAEVVMRGTSDLPIRLTASPFTFDPVGPGTARLAPALATEAPVAPAATGAPATAAEPATSAPASGDGRAWLVPAVVGAALVVMAGALLAVARRSRSGAARRGEPAIPGGTADAPGGAHGS